MDTTNSRLSRHRLIRATRTVTVACLFGALVMACTDQQGTETAPPPRADSGPVEQPAGGAPSAPVQEETPPAPDIKTGTAAQLWRAFDRNEVKATQKLAGHLIEINGVVKSIDLDALNNVVVRFNVPNEFGTVNAQLQEEERDKAAELSKGDHLTVLCGKVERIMGDPYLSVCGIDDTQND